MRSINEPTVPSSHRQGGLARAGQTSNDLLERLYPQAAKHRAAQLSSLANPKSVVKFVL